jgi:hypothetical protein
MAITALYHFFARIAAINIAFTYSMIAQKEIIEPFRLDKAALDTSVEHIILCMCILNFFANSLELRITQALSAKYM